MRMFPWIASAILAVAATSNAWAQTGGDFERVSIRSHFRERVTAYEQSGMRWQVQSYSTARPVPRATLSIIFGFGANTRQRQEIRHADFCPRGGELGRMPGGGVACILAVSAGDSTVQSVSTCQNGGYLGAVPGVDHDVCITGEVKAGRLVTVKSCPHGGHLGWVKGVDHEVCVPD